MVGKTSKIETKRLSKGQRTHNRRLKQAISKDAGITPQSGPQPAQVIKVKDQS